ncbi:hypothetical protein JCM3765_006532 [Sporobolomyces pararoseus]
MSSAVAIRLPGVEQTSAGGGAGGMTVTNPHPTRSNGMYCLDVRQQPRQARMAGSGEKADRRTVDPPPIIRLRVRRPHARRKSFHSLTDEDFVSPTLTHTHFCFASLIPENSEEELYELAGSKSKYVGGSVVSSLFHLRDQSCFVFPDLSVRTEGRWRFKMSMYEIVEDGVLFCDSVVTDVFQVYSSKKFPGMRQSTELSKSLAQQGLKLRIRRPEATSDHDGEDAQSQQPRRKKSKATPRQRTSLTNNSWSASPAAAAVPSPPSTTSGRRSSGPMDFSHSAPLIAPIGSTTSTSHQRPWTSWNASPSKNDPRYPSSFSRGLPSVSSLPTVPRSTSHDYRRLPQLDERNTAPNPNFDSRLSLPRMLDAPSAISTHIPFSRFPQQPMAPPLPRQSPPNLSRPTFPATSSHFASVPRPTTPPPILAPIRSDLSQPLERNPSLRWSDPFEAERNSRRKSNESSVRTTTSEENDGRGGTTEATSVPSSEAGGHQEGDTPPVNDKSSEELSSSRGGKGGLAMLLGDGATDIKQVGDINFF